MQEARNLENLRVELSASADDVWDDGLSFADNLTEIFNQSVIVPDKKIQLPIIISYCCLPSALCTVVPILFLQGKEGTGKSTAAIVIASVFGKEIFSAATSFAAIRNAVQGFRWFLPEKQEQEKNFGIVFDNVNAKTFLDEKLYTFFLNGYNRKTDRMEISNGDGTNLVFKVFCPKVCNSIHPLYGDSKLSEISRRMLPIKFKRIEEIAAEDIGNFDVYSRLDVENINLGILNEKFNELWSTENSVRFMELKRSLTGKNKIIKIPRVIKSHQWSLTLDMICAGCIAELWPDPFAATDAVANYWEWYNVNIAQGSSSFEVACSQVIKETVGNQQTIMRSLGIITALEIPCDVLKKRLDEFARQGALSEYPTPRVITDAMSRLGWQRSLNSKDVWVWVELT
jgi:hypothetical protein